MFGLPCILRTRAQETQKRDNKNQKKTKNNKGRQTFTVKDLFVSFTNNFIMLILLFAFLVCIIICKYMVSLKRCFCFFSACNSFSACRTTCVIQKLAVLKTLCVRKWQVCYYFVLMVSGLVRKYISESVPKSDVLSSGVFEEAV